MFSCAISYEIVTLIYTFLPCKGFCVNCFCVRAFNDVHTVMPKSHEKSWNLKMHFPGMEKSWILGKMAEVMQKSWNFIFLVQIFRAV